MKLVSRIYSSTKLNISGNIVEFKDGVAVVADKVGKEIIESKFPGIFEEGKEVVEASKPEADFLAQAKEMNEQYLDQIDHLKNVIKGKDLEIEELKVEVKNWKDEFTKLSENKKKEAVAPKKETKKVEEKKVEEKKEDDEVETLRKELTEMNLEEVKEIAGGEGVDPKLIEEADKDKLIDLIIEQNTK